MFIFCYQNNILMERRQREIISCIEIVCILRSCVFNSIKGVKTCVRLPCGNRIINHASVCKVLKQSAKDNYSIH